MDVAYNYGHLDILKWMIEDLGYDWKFLYKGGYRETPPHTHDENGVRTHTYVYIEKKVMVIRLEEAYRKQENAHRKQEEAYRNARKEEMLARLAEKKEAKKKPRRAFWDGEMMERLGLLDEQS